jgi:uncharacterized protein YneF (UPF0154 family)
LKVLSIFGAKALPKKYFDNVPPISQGRLRMLAVSLSKKRPFGNSAFFDKQIEE